MLNSTHGKTTGVDPSLWLESMSSPACIVEKSGRLVAINKVARRLLGLTRVIGARETSKVWPLLISSESEWRALIRTGARRAVTWKKDMMPKNSKKGKKLLEVSTRPKALPEERSLFEIRDVTSVAGILEDHVVKSEVLDGIRYYRASFDGHILELSKVSRRWHGFKSNAEALRHMTDLRTQYYVNPSDRARFLAVLKRKGHIEDFVAQVYRIKSGEKRWVTESARVVKDKRGRPLYIAGTASDITDLIQLQDEQRKREKEFQDFIDYSPEGYYRQAPDGTILMVNRTSARRAGFRSPSAYLKVLNDPKSGTRGSYVDGDRRGQFLAAVKEKGAISNFVSQTRRIGRRNLKGEEFWLNESARAVYGDDGELLYIESITRDASELMRTRKRLEQIEKEFNDFIDLSPDGYWRTTPDGQVLQESAAGANRFGFTSKAAFKKGLERGLKQPHGNNRYYVSPNRRQEFVEEIEAKGVIRNFISEVYKIGDKSPIHERKTIWISESGRAVRDERGNTLYYEGITRNVTELVEIRDALEKAKETAEEANRAKSYVFAAANHDLRQPLNALIMQLAVAKTLSRDRALAPVQNALSAAENLNLLIDQLLDLHRLEEGMQASDQQDFDLYELLVQIIAETRPALERAGLIASTKGQPTWVHSDPNLIARIVRNLIDNARRHSLAKHLSVGLETDHGGIVLFVKDDGKGIDPSLGDDVFKSFVRGPETGELDEPSGFGLGLSIVDALAKQLGLTVKLKSRPNRGSQFTIENFNPARAKKTAKRQRLQDHTDRPSLSDSLILVVDDDARSRKAIVQTLQTAGAQTLAARNLSDVSVELAKADTAPEAVVVDHNLGDGFSQDVFRVLRNLLGKKIPGIVVTGDPSKEMRRAIPKCYPIHQKPIDRERMLADLVRLLSLS